jgi:hypothetical protein
MTSTSGAGTARRGGEGGKSLKEQYRWQLWIIVAGNSLFLYGVVQANAIRLAGLRSAFTDAQNLVPVGLALVIATVLNGLLSPEAKARLVFLRWHHALPGHRAFSKYALHDPRIDVAALTKLHGSALPVDPVEQNRMWYRLCRAMDSDTAVREAHRDFLLLRDYTGLCAVFIVFYGAAALYAIPSTKIALIYLLSLIAQYAIVRQAAFNYGIRFVTTVIARWVAKEPSDVAKTSTKRTRGRANEGPSRTPRQTYVPGADCGHP